MERKLLHSERFKEKIAGVWSSNKKGVSDSKCVLRLTITDCIKLSNFTNAGFNGKEIETATVHPATPTVRLPKESIGERFELQGKLNIQVIVIDCGSPPLPWAHFSGLCSCIFFLFSHLLLHNRLPWYFDLLYYFRLAIYSRYFHGGIRKWDTIWGFVNLNAIQSYIILARVTQLLRSDNIKNTVVN